MNPGYGKDSKSFQKLNPHLFPPNQLDIVPNTAEPKAKRIRQSTKPIMNNLELDAYAQLQGNYSMVMPQSIKLKLGNGVWYTPDFIVIPKFVSEVYAFEVKGRHIWEDAIVKLKVAANAYQWIKFHLMWKDEAGVWTWQAVLP